MVKYILIGLWILGAMWIWRFEHPVPVSVPVGSKPFLAILGETTTTNALVVRVVDGDTLIVRKDGDTQDESVRLLGVNTPETVDPRRPVECFGKQASEHTSALAYGKRVRLESDPQADERDKYGRLLRNVVLSDGTDLNLTLVQEGYAHAYLSFPLHPVRKKMLKDAEARAKIAHLGLWNPVICGSL